MIRWQDKNGTQQEGSLFAVFAALARGEAFSFPALRPHQREPWHCFCVQVAAMALLKAGVKNLPQGEASWRDILIGLTPEYPNGEAWQLVTDDWMKPALLQPPMVKPENKLDYKSVITTPDELDMLVTSKNHDVKAARMVNGREEDWLFALVTLQTASSYGGGGNIRGISRMNGGTGSRFIMRLENTQGACWSFKRDTLILISDLSEENKNSIHNKKGLIWLEPWDGEVTLNPSDLISPLYIDCARRIRLKKQKAITAYKAVTPQPRICPKILKGATQDPWAPMKDDENESITPKRESFEYKKISEILKTPLPILAKPHHGDDPEGISVKLSAIIRSGGSDFTTAGLCYRSIRISRRISKGFNQEFMDAMGRVATHRTKDAGEAGKKLRHTLMELVQGGGDKVRLDDDASTKKIASWMALFDAKIDHIFFNDAFWAEVNDEDDNQNHSLLWRQELAAIARAVFTEAAKTAPRTVMRAMRARARALNKLELELGKFIKETANA